MDLEEEFTDGMVKNSVPSWDAYFLLIASGVSIRGNCTRRRIGAIIVDQDHRIVEAACNGAPEGHPQCLEGACPRSRKSYAEAPENTPPYDDCIAVHAEARAIIQGDYARMQGGTIYSTTSPCPDCMKLIVSAGIHRVVTPTHFMDLVSS